MIKESSGILSRPKSGYTAKIDIGSSEVIKELITTGPFSIKCISIDSLKLCSL